ncbi:hypothetical protein Tco_0455383 [Tanacetum coccineum]
MRDENPIHTLGDYSKPSHEVHRNTIELLEGNNVIPLTLMMLQEILLAWVYSTILFMTKLSIGLIIYQQDSSPLGRISLPGESLSDAWTRFKDLLQKVPHHGIDLWFQVQIFYDCIDQTLKRTIDYAAEGRLRKMSAEKAWATIEELARYEDEGWNDPILLEEGSLVMGRSEDVCGMTSDIMRQLPPEASRQEAFEDLVLNFIHDQEEKVKQLEECMCFIGSDFMQLFLELIERLKKEIRIKENGVKKVEKITRYPDIEDLEPLNGHEFSKALTKKASFHMPKFVSPKSLYIKYVHTIFPSPSLLRKSTFGFKPGTNNNWNVKF